MAIANIAIPIRPARQTLNIRRGLPRQQLPLAEPAWRSAWRSAWRTSQALEAHREYTTQGWQACLVVESEAFGEWGWRVKRMALATWRKAAQIAGWMVANAFAGAPEPSRRLANAAQAPTADAAWGEVDDAPSPIVQTHRDDLGAPKQPTPQGRPQDAPGDEQRNGQHDGSAPMNAPIINKPVNGPERIASYEAFFQRHERDIFGYLWRLTGDEQLAYDLRQETFLRAWNHYDQLLDYHQPVAWLFRVATNLAINQLRRRKAPVGAAAPLDLVGDPGLSDPSWRLAENDLVRQTLTALPPRQRAALVMREVYGFSVEEVARTLGVTPAAVRMTLWRAREQFRTLYTRANGAPRWSPGAARQRQAAQTGDESLGAVDEFDAPDDQQTQPVEAYHGGAEPATQHDEQDDDDVLLGEQIVFQPPTGTDWTEGGEA